MASALLLTDKLDGLVMGGKRKREGDDVAGMDDFLQLPDDYATRHSEPGKKRVKWHTLLYPVSCFTDPKPLHPV